MARKSATKNIYYLRASNEKQPFDIEELLKTIRRDRPTVGDTEVELGSGDILRIQHYRDEGKEYKDGECFLLLKITMSCFVAMG